MKKLLALLLACSTMTFAMVGCGDKDKDDDDDDKDSKSSSVVDDDEDEDDEDEDDDKDDEDESSDDEDESSDDEDESSDDEDEVSDDEDESSDDEDEFSDDEDESSADDDDDSNVISDGPTTVEPGLVDDELVGSWYNAEMGGSFYFDADNNVALSMDYSSIMYFDEDQNLVMSGILCPSEYDGTNLSVSLSNDFAEEGAEDVMEMLVLERADGSDASTIDGEYALVGGELYTELEAALFDGNSNSKLYMVIDGETLLLKVDICDYTADGSQCEMYGDGLELFGLSAQEEAVLDYTISGDTLTMGDTSGEEMEFTRE